MSLRNIRKCYGVTGLPPPEDDADEFEPSYTQRHTKSLYAGLEVEVSCSNSEGERNSDEENSDKVVLETPQPEATKKKKNKKKRKQHRQKGKTEDLQEVEELDDIDRSLLEVNAILGAPEEPLEKKPQKDIKKIRQNLFTVRQQHLEAENELRRRFGADDEDDKKKRGRQPNLRSIAQKSTIIKTDKVYKKCGLSMTIVKRENDLTYFAFVHNKEYQRLHRTFLVSQNESSQTMLYPLEESQRRMHVEGLLETADRLYYVEQYSAGNKVIEEIIIYMQQCAHPFFSVTDIRARLQYKHVENRAFHIALLKYMHMLTNKACHRTALEFGKLLLNLDPSDPLAVLFIIDSIAIRAGEYQWLIEAIEFWSEERDAGFLFNMMYSLALAEFHVARKKKDEEPIVKKEEMRKPLSVMQVAGKSMRDYIQFSEDKPTADDKDAKTAGADYEKADSLLIKAMLQFPTVVIQMLKIAGIRNSTINSCPLFNPDNNDRSSANLKNLIALYAKFIWHKFLEDPAQKWFIRNAAKIAEDFSTDQQMQVRIMEYANRRMNLFQTYPSEIVRHLCILSPLNNLIVDGAVPEVADFVSYDPEPPLHGVNRYERQSNPDGENGFFQFFTSMMPEHELMDAGLERIPDIPSPIRAGSPPPDPAPPLQFRMLPQEFDDATEDEIRLRIRSVNDLALLEAALADDDASGEGVTDAVRYFMNLYDTMFDGRFDVHEGLRQFANAVNRTSDSEEDSDAYILFTDPQVLDFDSDHDLLNEIQLAASEGSHDLPRQSQPLVESIEHTDEPENAHIVHEPQNDLLEDDIGGKAENQQADEPKKSAQDGHEQRSGLLEENSVEPEKQEPLSVNFIYEEQNGSLQGGSEQEQQLSKDNFLCEKKDSNDDDGKPDKQPQTINFVFEGHNDIDKIDSEGREEQQSIAYLDHENRRYSLEDNLNNTFDGGVTPSKLMKKNDENYPTANHNFGEEGEFNILSDRDGAVGGDMYNDYKMPGSDNDEGHEDAEESEDDDGDAMNSSDKNSENNGGDGDCDDDDEEGDEDEEGREGEQRKDGGNGDDDDNEDDDEEDDEEVDDDIDQGDIDHDSDGLDAMEDLDNIDEADYMNNHGYANDIDQGDIDHNSDGLDAMEDLDDIDDAEYMNNHGNANDMNQWDIDNNSDGLNAMEDLDDIDDAEYMNNHGNANHNEAIASSRNFMLQRVHTNPRNGYHFNRLQLMLQNGMLPLLLVPRDFDVVGLNVLRDPAAPPSEQR